MVDYKKIASSLLLLEGAPNSMNREATARRYLTIRRRLRVLEEGIERAHRACRANSPLRSIRFHAPLSVAGCDSLTIVMAEGLSRLGIPIAFERETKGGHRGTPIDEAISDLDRFGWPAPSESNGPAREFDYKRKVVKLLGFYKDYMGACPARLSEHRVGKFARIPSLINRLTLARWELEERLNRIVTHGEDYVEPRFVVMVPTISLRKLVAGSKGAVVSIGYGKSLKIGAQSRGVTWGRGNGVAMVYRQHLNELLAQARDHEVVLMSFGLEKDWLGWLPEHSEDAETLLANQSRAWKFKYPQ